MSILSIPQVFEPLGPMRSKRRDFSSQTPLLHYPPPITGFKYLFQIFDSVMARRRIYREHQVSESLHSFFAVKFMVHTSLKKILEVPNGTLDTRKKLPQKFAALFPISLLTSMEREKWSQNAVCNFSSK